MNTPSAKDLLQAMPVHMVEGGVAEGGVAEGRVAEAANILAPMSRGMAAATAQDGIGVDQYYKNINAYVAKQSDPLKALEDASRSGVSLEDAANAMGQDKLNAYLNIDLNTETTPIPKASGYVSRGESNWEKQTGPGGGQAGLDRAIQAAVTKYRDDPTTLEKMFIAEGINISDVLHAGVDPTLMLSFTEKLKKDKDKDKDKQIATGVFTPVTLPPVYQSLPTPPPLYPTGQPALDVDFRNSAPRSAWDPIYGYSYTRLLPNCSRPPDQELVGCPRL